MSRSNGKRNGTEAKRSTLTRELLIKKTRPRFAWVQVEGFGRVGLRSIDQLQASRRIYSAQTPDGKPIPGAEELVLVHRIIDHVMTDENTPMFSDADVELIQGMDADALGPLIQAIEEFAGADPTAQGSDKGG